MAKLFFRILKNKLSFLFKIEKRDPYRLLVKVCDNCNYRCAICGNWESEKNGFISKDNIKKIEDKFKNKLFFLSVTGGEPFLEEKKLTSFLVKIIKKNPNLFHISINTNCSKPRELYNVSKLILTNFPNIRLKIGLHYIPNKRWGLEKTGVEGAYNSYCKTLKTVNALKEEFRGRFSFYKMITVDKKEDFFYLKEGEDLWLNFAVTSSFYKNISSGKVKKINREDKLNIINSFLKKNKKNMSYLNKRYLKELQKIIRSGKRKRECYAGLNRFYINEKGEEFICSMEVLEREKMNKDSCNLCWTACEANFDLLANFLI